MVKYDMIEYNYPTLLKAFSIKNQLLEEAMSEKIDYRFKKLEGAIMMNNYPRLENHAHIALFYKKAMKGKVLYINVQEQAIESFVAENYAQKHQNTSFELFYVLSGSILNQIEDREFLYQAGQGCLLNRRITHSDIIEDGHLLVLNFSEHFLRDLFTSIEDSPYINGAIFQFLQKNLQGEDDWKRSYIEFHPTLPIVNHSFRNILDSLQLELATPKIGADFLQKGLALRLLHALEDTTMFRLNQIDIDLKKEDFLVSRLVSFIETNYGNISRKQIEEQLHYNAEYLNRLLKKHSRRTITTYAKGIRINRAEQLLKTTNLKITQIADLLGFSSENYFYHYFKEETGSSPNQYRQAYKEKKNR